MAPYRVLVYSVYLFLRGFQRSLAFLSSYICFKTLLQLKVSTSYLRPFPWHTVKSLLHISVPSGGETLSYQLSQTTIMKMVNILGLTVINTKVYVYVIAMLCYVYTIALSNASQVIVGFLMGAKREDEVTNRVWHSMF